jgi:hypothetical protein
MLDISCLYFAIKDCYSFRKRTFIEDHLGELLIFLTTTKFSLRYHELYSVTFYEWTFFIFENKDSGGIT